MSIFDGFVGNLESKDVIALIGLGLDTGGEEWVASISNEIESDQESEQYVWLGTAPSMRPWTGGRQPDTLRENDYRVYNKDFEATLEIKIDWLRRDKTGQIQLRINQLVESANLHDAELLSALILVAGSTVCYDGQYFFDTDHQEGDSPSQANMTTHTSSIGSTGVTAAEFGDALITAIQNMLLLKDDRGRPMNQSAKRFLLMVPVALMKAAYTALGADIILSGGQSQTNIVKAVGSYGGFIFDVVTNARLTWTDKFVLFRQDAAAKPFVKQIEVPLQVSALAEGSEEEFKNKRHLYGVNRTMNFGLGMWQGAYQMQFV
ncbi:MAG: Mu-like prophage major head subunit gpT family protein [Acidobacteria bacterium]|nr:Mu-like prophage major head subunit gpT family protein [Acidobacteriota bacterium]